MSDLSDFLRARLDEDEATAKAVPAKRLRYVDDDGREWMARSWRELVEDGIVCDDRAQAHMARHDPARVLAEVAAKRALVDSFAFASDLCPEDDWPDSGDMSAAPLADAARYHLRYLAMPYADHPDYRDEWKP